MPKTSNEQQIADFTQTIGTLVRRIRAAAAEHGLSMTEWSVLRRLDKEGSATTAALARAENIKPQSMGAIIAELEESGYVSRAPHPTDGRQMVISITDKGIGLRQDMLETKRTWLGQQLSQLSTDERDTVFEAGRILKRMLEL
jgi:DNA-binding MarR family transcriptional regulator